MPFPAPRGTLSAGVIAAIAGERAGERVDWELLVSSAREVGYSGDILVDEDVQWCLYVLYELHYRGITGVSDSWEWHPDLLRVRAELEAAFERRLREVAATVPVPEAADIAETLFAMTAPTKDRACPGIWRAERLRSSSGSS